MPTVGAIIILGAIYFLWGLSPGNASGVILPASTKRTAGDIRIVQEGLGGIRDVILDGAQARVVDDFRAADGQLASAQADFAYVASSRGS